MGHQPLPVVAQRDDRQLEVDATGILRRQLVDLGHMNKPHRKELEILVRLAEEILDPFHRLGMQEEVGPFHEFIAAETPELCRVSRFLLDVVEDKRPIRVARLGRIERLAIGMVELVAELALDRAITAQTERNLAGVHFTDENLTIVGAIFEDRRRLENREGSGHGDDRSVASWATTARLTSSGSTRQTPMHD